jgi:hypothetical protein
MHQDFGTLELTFLVMRPSMSCKSSFMDPATWNDPFFISSIRSLWRFLPSVSRLTATWRFRPTTSALTLVDTPRAAAVSPDACLQFKGGAKLLYDSCTSSKWQSSRTCAFFICSSYMLGLGHADTGGRSVLRQEKMLSVPYVGLPPEASLLF